MKIGFHTDAFNSSYWNFDQCLKWAQDNGVRFIECGAIDGVSWIHGLGYQPHVALWEDPIAVRRKMDDHGVQMSQIDAAFPLSLPTGSSLGVKYIINTIRWAHHAGCPIVDTTDDRYAPKGMTDKQAMEMMKRSYDQVLEVAQGYNMKINIEPHGYYTTNPDFMEEMLNFFDTPLLGLNMDTGNTFIAKQDPVAFLERFKHRVTHVHVKDVSQSLAESAMGEITGIPISHAAIGEGVNSDNIKKCLEILHSVGFDGVLSLECEGAGGPMIERSLEWLRDTLKEKQIG